ncbi:MAG: FAD-dependent oxidoreductase [Xanthobacteraceae bacterium]
MSSLPMTGSNKSYDVLIVGAGMAGLSAALSAAEDGAYTLVLEKSDRIGGNASIAAGMFLGSADFDGLHAYIPDGDPALQRALCADFDASLLWLEAHGLPLGPTIDFGDFRKLRPMASGQPGNRQAFMAALAERAQKTGVQISTRVHVESVRRERTGFAVDAIEAGTRRTFLTKSIVLATGGFAASRTMLERYLGEGSDHLKIRSGPGASGDGIALAQSLGAALGGDVTAFYGHTMADCALTQEDWQPLTPYFARLAVLVNRDGRRFVDESPSLLEELNAQAGFRQPGGKYWLVFDERIRTGEPGNNGSDKVLPAGDWLARARAVGAPLFEAATLPELIAKLAAEGIEKNALTSELGAYNAACGAGQHARLQPPKRLTALPLAGPPFYALRCVAGITATCGGIAVDDRGRVLDALRHPLPGIFSAGTDAGGVYGKTYGGFLAWALVSGRRAGKTAATEIVRG